MNYHIEFTQIINDKKRLERIASFEYDIDRDNCLDLLKKTYSDIKFRKVDDV